MVKRVPKDPLCCPGLLLIWVPQSPGDALGLCSGHSVSAASPPWFLPSLMGTKWTSRGRTGYAECLLSPAEPPAPAALPGMTLLLRGKRAVVTSQVSTPALGKSHVVSHAVLTTDSQARQEVLAPLGHCTGGEWSLHLRTAWRRGLQLVFRLRARDRDARHTAQGHEAWAYTRAQAAPVCRILSKTWPSWGPRAQAGLPPSLHPGAHLLLGHFSLLFLFIL